MGQYKELLEAIKSVLEEEFKVGTKNSLLNEVRLMRGGFNGIDDILNFSQVAPCVGIGIRGFPKNIRNYGDQLESIADLSLYLITTDKDKEDIGDGVFEALELLEKLKNIIKNGKWDLSWVKQTEYDSLSSKNYYADQFYKNGITLWEITWKQIVVEKKILKPFIPIKEATAKVNIHDATKQEEVTFKLGSKPTKE